MSNASRRRNPLLVLRELGQSVWLDYIRRKMLVSGELERLIAEDGLAGMTSNPTIFEQAIGGSDDYEEAITRLARRGADAVSIYRELTREDIALAADRFLPLYHATEGRDGYVSLEVSPHLARDTDATVVEAEALWASLARPNVMIKVPGTPEGLPAIRRLIASGINVNVTLLFSVERYLEVAEAYLAGLEARAQQGAALAPVASVASFFLSRIDVLVDERLDARSEPAARALRGRTAIACARLAYRAYRRIYQHRRWAALAAAGARTQRLLWASTGTKDPAYSDVMYVDALVGPDTVNTMPPQTLAAYRDHGDPAPRLEHDLEEAEALGERLRALGIDLREVARQLEHQGIDKFVAPYDKLLATIEARRRALAASP